MAKFRVQTSIPFSQAFLNKGQTRGVASRARI